MDSRPCRRRLYFHYIPPRAGCGGLAEISLKRFFDTTKRGSRRWRRRLRRSAGGSDIVLRLYIFFLRLLCLSSMKMQLALPLHTHTEAYLAAGLKL